MMNQVDGIEGVVIQWLWLQCSLFYLRVRFEIRLALAGTCLTLQRLMAAPTASATPSKTFAPTSSGLSLLSLIDRIVHRQKLCNNRGEGSLQETNW